MPKILRNDIASFFGGKKVVAWINDDENDKVAEESLALPIPSLDFSDLE